MIAMLMMNCIVYDDDISYFFDVVDIDHRLELMTNCDVTKKEKSVNAIEFDCDCDFDCYFVEIVCDDGDFCDGDDDVYEISSSFSSSCVLLQTKVKENVVHRSISFEKKSMMEEREEQVQQAEEGEPILVATLEFLQSFVFSLLVAEVRTYSREYRHHRHRLRRHHHHNDCMILKSMQVR